MSAYFITGTDTGVGKTWAVLTLMQIAKAQGKKVCGMKPIASGCHKTGLGLCNSDALSILRGSSQPLNYHTVNPYAFAEDIAPHIAAGRAGACIDINRIAKEFAILKQNAELIFVEGIGGWCVPLSHDLMLADMVKHLRLPVILVVGMRLGCINHTLSTVRAIQADGVRLQGWISNQLSMGYDGYHETLDILQKKITAPLLGSMPYMQQLDPARTDIHIDMADLDNTTK